MTSCAPNLQAVVGDTIGARLISHAGGLSNLAKCPASTVQVLGAEKALFRALKTRCSTPKYGLIFHSPFIASARRPDKGKVSRALANKCALASRIDCFGEKSGSAYGERMRAQLDEKLEFLATGKRATSNAEAMRAVRATMVEKAAEAKADRKHGELGGKRKRKVGRGEGKAKKAKIGGED